MSYSAVLVTEYNFRLLADELDFAQIGRSDIKSYSEWIGYYLVTHGSEVYVLYSQEEFESRWRFVSEKVVFQEIVRR